MQQAVINLITIGLNQPTNQNKSNQNNQLRGVLAKSKMKVTVVKNSLASKALKGAKLEKAIRENLKKVGYGI